ncbi:unnamed protein product [Moneuplotes crassus]|uniref:Uncharacterized protein n=1 Tax=Euplotes crassus TaxID=5936 RepID=A0AAD1URJ5_EUPCR|nr:unnamed protein product [Moneuplotes crassus]
MRIEASFRLKEFNKINKSHLCKECNKVIPLHENTKAIRRMRFHKKCFDNSAYKDLNSQSSKSLNPKGRGRSKGS